MAMRVRVADKEYHRVVFKDGSYYWADSDGHTVRTALENELEKLRGCARGSYTDPHTGVMYHVLEEDRENG